MVEVTSLSAFCYDVLLGMALGLGWAIINGLLGVISGGRVGYWRNTP